MKVKPETTRLILYLYPFIAMPIAFFLFSASLYPNYLFVFSISFAISGFGVLSYSILYEKLNAKPKYRSLKNYESSFYSKNRHNKPVLRYSS